MQSQVNESIQTHYSRQDLISIILSALANAGIDINKLTLEDLASIDEFHIRGREATLELARAVGLNANKYILDVGSGIGGTSRCIAKEFGCYVTGIDLTEEYCRTATILTDKIGLSHSIKYIQGDATNLPFDDQTFDVVWTEHVAMNISDKTQLYKEMNRVLKPNGTLAIYDVLEGPNRPVLFPVPWAQTPDSSFLATPKELRELLENAGFTISDWSDTTEAAREWFVTVAEKIRKEGFPPLGFHLLMGDNFKVMAQNQGRNLQEGRIVLAQIAAQKMG